MKSAAFITLVRIEATGENLIRNSNFVGKNFWTADAEAAGIVQDKDLNWFSAKNLTQTGKADIKTGETFTLSGVCDGFGTGSLSFGDGEAQTFDLEPGPFTHTFTSGADADSFTLTFSGDDPIKIAHPKLEVGPSATTWSANPQDVIDEINGFNADNKAIIDQLHQYVNSSISKSNAELMSVFKSTYVSAADNDRTIASLTSQITQTSDSLTASFSEVSSRVDDVSGAVQSLTTEIITADENGISIRSPKDQTSIQLSDDGISMNQGDTIVAYLNDDSWSAPTLSVSGQLYLGNFGFIVNEDGSLSLRKVK